MKSDSLFNIGVQAQVYRTSKRSMFQYRLFLIAEMFLAFHIDIDHDLTDLPGLRNHYFFDGAFSSFDMNIMGSCRNTHNGYHTAAQGRCYQVGRGKTLALALVILWRIRFDLRTRLQVGGSGPQLTVINYL